MAARQQAIISQQRQQTTGSPVVPQQSLPNPAQQAAGIVRAPSQATTGSPATETKSLPPAAKRARVDGPGQPPLQQGQGGPPRPGSVAQQQVAAYNPVGGPAAIADDIASRVPSAGKPEPFPHARPTLSQGLAAQPIVSTPGVTYRPAAGQQSAHPPLTPAQLAAQERLDAARVVPRSSLREILQSICPGANMDDEVEDVRPRSALIDQLS